MDSHEHCRNCYNMRCTSKRGCPMVFCSFGCGVKLHECKIADHNNICGEKRVRCVNAYYGCPMSMARSQIGTHIQNCPASVVQCTQVWGRNPSFSSERLKWVPFKQSNPVLVKGCLEVEFAFHDQKVINEMRKDRCKTGFVKRFSKIHDLQSKFSYKRAKMYADEVKAFAELNPSFHYDSFEEEEREEIINKSIDVSTNSSGYDNIPECPLMPNARPGLGLNLNIDIITSFGRHSHSYQIPCQQILRRNEYGAHFKNVHAEIQGGFGWIERRCPLAQYGCPFIDYPLLPSNLQSKIVFSEILGVFGVKSKHWSGQNSYFCAILCLPSELLEEICKWLDGFSLTNLMLTCRTLHLNLSRLVINRGVVTPRWQKRIYEDGSSSWIFAEKVRKFLLLISLPPPPNGHSALNYDWF